MPQLGALIGPLLGPHELSVGRQHRAAQSATVCWARMRANLQLSGEREAELAAAAAVGACCSFPIRRAQSSGGGGRELDAAHRSRANSGRPWNVFSAGRAQAKDEEESRAHLLLSRPKQQPQWARNLIEATGARATSRRARLGLAARAHSAVRPAARPLCLRKMSLFA